MKIVFFIFSLLIHISSLHALESVTLEKGLTRLGLGFGLDEDNSNIGGSYGRFFSDKLLVGVGISAFTAKVSSFRSTNFSVGPYINYYFYQTVFAGLSVQYERQIYEDSINPNSWLYEVNLSLGKDFFLSKNVSFRPVLNYSFDIETSNSQKDDGPLRLSGNFSYFF